MGGMHVVLTLDAVLLLLILMFMSCDNSSIAATENA